VSKVIDIRFPRPAVDEYAVKTAVVVLTLAVIEYLGLFGSQAGTIDWRFLLLVGIMFPVFRYAIEVIAASAGIDVLAPDRDDSGSGT
jgi:hypothetical protein